MFCAKRSTRFLILIIDNISLVIIGIVIGIIFNDFLQAFNDYIFSTILSIIFYVIFEAVWQKTPGKFLTKTKVVTFDGQKPSLKTIIGRSFARLIPFDALSFLGNKYPIGWHDRLSNTLVVPDTYSTQEIVQIEKKQKSSWVVILVVIGGILITGILATLAVVALGNARMKSRDAERVADMRQVMSALALYYNDAGSYPTQLVSGKPILYKDAIYMQEMPSNPTPRNDGDCPDQDYVYSASEDNKTYTVDYCVADAVGEVSAGKHRVTPDKLD